MVFEATTTSVDWKSYTCKRAVCSSLAGETLVCMETLGMLEFTKVFILCSWTLGKAWMMWNPLVRNNTKSPVITDAKSLYELW